MVEAWEQLRQVRAESEMYRDNWRAAVAELEAVRATHARLRRAAEAAHEWLIDPERGGHHKDNPIPANLRAALEEGKP